MTVAGSVEHCLYAREWYLAHRAEILAKLQVERDARRLDRIEQAVLHGRPIGQPVAACGTKSGRVRHRKAGEVCGTCQHIKALEVFDRTCLATTAQQERTRDRDRAYYAANKAQRRAQNAAWAAAHQEDMKAYQRRHAQTPEARAKTKAWKEANPDRMRESRRRHYDAMTPEERRQIRAAWRAANPDRSRAITAASKAARRARENQILREHIDRQLVWERDGGICQICTQPADPTRWHLDHVIPLARGGDHLYSNVQVSHPFCNLSKGAKVA